MSVKERKGLKIYYVDIKTKEIGEVEFKEKKFDFLSGKKNVRYPVIGRYHLTFYAINRTNADKKAEKILEKIKDVQYRENKGVRGFFSRFSRG